MEIDNNIIIVIVAVVIGLIILGFVGFLISIYNALVRMRNNISKSWANIDVILKQRSDELPKLVDSVKGYMKYEEGVLTKVTEARTKFLDAQTVQEKAKANNMITDALKSLFAVAENYPTLKANESFLQLQTRISGLENELADRREFYNDSVNEYNIKIDSFPDLIVARMMGYTQPETMFEVDESDKKDVKIDFS